MKAHTQRKEIGGVIGQAGTATYQHDPETYVDNFGLELPNGVKVYAYVRTGPHVGMQDLEMIGTTVVGVDTSARGDEEEPRATIYLNDNALYDWTPPKPPVNLIEELKQASRIADRCRQGDSNDEEIEALQEVQRLALELADSLERAAA